MSKPSELPIALDPESGLPLYVQIARALAADVRRGRLAPGAILPGTRSLARALGVHRNTVLAAYGELTAEGWAVARPGGGTFVSEALPDALSARAVPADSARGLALRPAFSLQPEEKCADPEDPEVELMMYGGTPDLRLFPSGVFARAYRRALARGASSLLSYTHPEGEPKLRAALASLVARRRAVPASAENVLVTRGSQMAIDLLARVLCAPGDAVAVESLGYEPARRAFRAAGATLVPIPVDRDGLVVEALVRAARRRRIRAVYVTPHHQYPTTALLSPGRRLALLELAARERMAILEDDYDHEFHHDGRPVLPLSSLDERGSVVYLGTLSKVLAPGLRVGFIVAAAQFIERLARERFYVDRQGDWAIEAAVAELVEDGELERHVRKMARVYRSRRDVLLAELEKRLAGRFEPRLPTGGMALWGRVLGGVDVEEWRRRALDRGVLFQTARQFALDGRVRPFARLGFAALSEAELREAVRRLAAAWPADKPRG